MKEHKPFSMRIFVYPALFILAVAVYKNHTANSNVIPVNKNVSQVQTITVPPPNAIKVGEFYAPYYIDENSKLNTIIENLKERCSRDEVCEVTQAFKYVSQIPYIRSETHRTPVDVIVKNGGDCDEKAQLFAMILIETNHNCVVVYTKDHAFIAVEIENTSKINRNNARLKIENKDYFYAETTDKNGYVGKFNGVYPDEIQGIYHINEKRNIPKEEIEFLSL
ncbi:MAG: hypothetical protein Q8M43_04765 [Sulfuricurvum sp.]|uniref:hypothetical protein n=1 Tax=Sulfuricurvum sp. TaxID=2025608 RepID=UPI002736D44E|nr:hypothetical protein [Sulfuricurvum sp.]MDP2850719.1 hypothetical protein [Sulfuricurvum sp.]MDP3291326.1 hypothetical protein [Sulfuricurvum sp.]